MITTIKDAKEIKDTLPDTMSGLIRVALKDLEKAEKKSDTYFVYMETWHSRKAWNSHAEYDGRCAMCFAGSVMAGTLEVSPDIELDPDDFSPSLSRKLLALNALRLGSIESAAIDIIESAAIDIDAACHNEIDVCRNKVSRLGFTRYEVCSYDKNRKHFKRDMRGLIKKLEEAGL